MCKRRNSPSYPRTVSFSDLDHLLFLVHLDHTCRIARILFVPHKHLHQAIAGLGHTLVIDASMRSPMIG